jgi:phosphomannomutase/phosphoglucomutase
MPVYEEGLNHRLLAELADKATFNDALNVITLDGLRVEYADGFGLMRGSNTTPVITFRFEADNPEAIQRIQADFKSQVSRVTDLPMPF